MTLFAAANLDIFWEKTFKWKSGVRNNSIEDQYFGKILHYLEIRIISNWFDISINVVCPDVEKPTQDQYVVQFNLWISSVDQ